MKTRVELHELRKLRQQLTPDPYNCASEQVKILLAAAVIGFFPVSVLLDDLKAVVQE